jgi:hypothetical protein
VLGKRRFTHCGPLIAAMTLSWGIWFNLSAHAGNDDEVTFYTEYTPRGFPAVRQNPSEMRVEVSLKRCREYAANGFTFYIFESDALRKFDRFGNQGVDDDDRKWISAHDNRKAACLALMKQFGEGSYLEQAKAWLRDWLK